MTELEEAFEALNGYVVDERFVCGEFIEDLSYELDADEAAAIQQLILDMHGAHAETEARMKISQRLSGDWYRMFAKLSERCAELEAENERFKRDAFSAYGDLACMPEWGMDKYLERAKSAHDTLAKLFDDYPAVPQ